MCSSLFQSPGVVLCSGIKNGTPPSFVPLQIGERPGTKATRDEAYGLNFFGIAAASSGFSGVIVLTMHGVGMPGKPWLTFKSQSIAEQIVFGPRTFMIRCVSGQRSAGHD